MDRTKPSLDELLAPAISSNPAKQQELDTILAPAVQAPPITEAPNTSLSAGLQSAFVGMGEGLSTTAGLALEATKNFSPGNIYGSIPYAPEISAAGKALDMVGVNRDLFRENVTPALQEAQKNINYQMPVTFEETISSGLTGDFSKVPSLMAHAGVNSIPYLLPSLALGPAGTLVTHSSIAGQIAEERAENKGMDEAGVRELVEAMPASAASFFLERIGARGVLGKAGEGIVGGASKEAITEALQETIEYLGATLFTDKIPEIKEAAERAGVGFVGGGVSGGAMSAAGKIGSPRVKAPPPAEDEGQVPEGSTEQQLGSDSQQVDQVQPEVGQVAAQVPVSLNRDDLADAIRNETALPEAKMVDLPQVEIDPLLQAQGFVVGANVEQITSDGEIINGIVASAQEIDGELEITVVQPDGNLRTLFASDGELAVEQPQQQPVEAAPEPLVDPVQEQPPIIEQPLAPAPEPMPVPTAPQPEVTAARPEQQRPKSPQNPYAEMGAEQLTKVLNNIEAQAKISKWNKMLIENKRKVVSELNSRFPEWDIPTKINIANAEKDVNLNPTEKQKEAGNYRKGAVSIQGLPISIENPKGAVRTGTDANGQTWEIEMPASYGYLKRTTGADGEQIDVYVGDMPSSPNVYIIDQIDADTRKYDEHKVFIGFESSDQVKVTYNAAFSDGRATQRYGGMTEMTMPEFKEWLKKGKNRKPLQYKEPDNAAQSPDNISERPVAEQEVTGNTDGVADLPVGLPAPTVDEAAQTQAAEPQQAVAEKSLTAEEAAKIDPFYTPYAPDGDTIQTREQRASDIFGEGDGFISVEPFNGDQKEALYTVAIRYQQIMRQRMRDLENTGKAREGLFEAKPVAARVIEALTVAQDMQRFPEAKEMVAKLRADAVDIASRYEPRIVNRDDATTKLIRDAENLEKTISKAHDLWDKLSPVNDAAGADQATVQDSLTVQTTEQSSAVQEPVTSTPETPERTNAEKTFSNLVKAEGALLKPDEAEILSRIGIDPESVSRERDIGFGQKMPSYTHSTLQEILPPANNEVVYHSTNLKNAKSLADRLMRGVKRHDSVFVSPDRYLALGQKGNTVTLVLDPSRVWGTIPVNAANVARPGSEYVVSISSPKSVSAIIVKTKRSAEALSNQSILKKYFDFEALQEVEGGFEIQRKVTNQETSSPEKNNKNKDIDKKVSEKEQKTKKSDKTVQENQNTDKIEDFGEKLEGAKKDLWETYNHTLTEKLPEDLSQITMSKHFPEPNYDQLIEDGIAVERLATFKAIRDQIGNKPRVAYKLKRWAEEVKDMRELAHSILNDGKAFEDFKKQGEAIRQLGGFFDRIQLYKELGYPAFTKAKDWNIRKSMGVYENGKPLEGTFWFVANKGSWGTRYDSYDQAVQGLKKNLVEDKGTERKTKLDIYRVTKTGEIYIGKKVGSNKYIDLQGGFENGRAARAYANENYDTLIELLKKKKDVPPVRRSTNDPRIGEDYRDGKDVSPEQFSETFGFRGVQFGNYVEQKKRVGDLNNAFDGLTDMARIIGVPELALSLNGSLGLAFGARGSGGRNSHAAHYEPGNIVINLTKISGAGSLGHEWFHALDNYFGRMNEGGFITERPFARKTEKVLPVREEVVDAYRNLITVIRKETEMVKRSRELDKLRTKDYWSTDVELTARAFEAYLIRKGEQAGGRNDYLANIDSRANFEAIMGEGTYPYPIDTEISAIVKAYDKLFETIQTKQTDKGVAMFKRVGEQAQIDAKVSGEIEQLLNSRLSALGWPQANFRIYSREDQPQALVGLDESVEGYYWRGIIHVSMEASDVLGTLNHEIIHGLKSFGAFTEAEWSTLEGNAQKWRDKYNIDATYREVMISQGITNPASLERRLNEEAIAHAFQDFANKGMIRRLANKAVRFIRSIGNVLSGRPYNFKTAYDVFNAIETGEVAARVSEELNPFNPASDFPMYKLSKSKKPALEQATKSLATIRGLESNLNNDLKKISALILHPQQIATLYPEFTPVYRAVIERFKSREVLMHQLSKDVDLYNKLKPEAKKRVNAALEIGRLVGTTYKPNDAGTITVKNEGLKNTVHSKDGDTITLTTTEAAAYVNVRNMFDSALDKYMESILEEFGLLEKGVRTIQDVEKIRLEASKQGDVNEVRRFKEILKRLNDVVDAKKRGYIPFKRWGQVGVSVKNADGDMVHFERIELPQGVRGALTNKKRLGDNKAVSDAVDRLSKQYNTTDFDINFFEMNRFDEVGANLDLFSLDVLASSSEMSQDDYRKLRDMLEKEAQKRGFRSHFFRSNDVPGYSDDFERAINDYVVTISSYISRRMHQKNIDGQVSTIAEAGMRDLYEYANGYVDYTNDPKEEIAGIRMMGFFWYLAGNISSGMVNLTQPFIVTAPWFNAKFSHGQIAKNMTKAFADITGLVDIKKAGMDVFDFNKAPSDVRDALIMAQQKGDFLSMATHDAMAISNSNTQALRGLDKKKRAAQEAVALTFSVPEKINRIATFTAAYRLALEPGAEKKIMAFIKNDNFSRSMLEGKTGKDLAFAYAELAVVSTQYRVGKLNRPKITRGYGSLVFQFWSFMMQTFELMYKLGAVHGGKNKQALAVMLLSVVGVAGFKGLPFEDDLQDLIEKLYNFRTGKDLDIDTKMREALIEYTGSPFMAETILKGLPASVLNLDMSGRLGFGNVAPDSGSDFLGVWWDMLYERPMRAAEYANKGDGLRAAAEVMPAFIRNPLTAYTWKEDGIRTQRGNKVLDADDLSNWDIGLKFLGFTTSDITRKRDEVWAASRVNNAVNALRSKYYGRIARALVESDRLYEEGDLEGSEQMRQQVDAIMEEINRHNQTHPLHKQIIPNKATIKQRYMEEMDGADARRVRKQARPRREELKEIYGYR